MKTDICPQTKFSVALQNWRGQKCTNRIYLIEVCHKHNDGYKSSEKIQIYPPPFGRCPSSQVLVLGALRMAFRENPSLAP